MSAEVKRVQELMEAGKSLEEALALVIEEAKLAGQGSNTRRDNIAYIKSLRNLPEARRCKKIAHAKISKSKGKAASIANYRAEIAAATEVIKALEKEIESAEIPWKKAMELGEDAAGAFNWYLAGITGAIEEAVKEAKGKMTNAELKAALLAIQPKVPSFVPKVFKGVWATRMSRMDMQVIALAKKAAFVKGESK